MERSQLDDSNKEPTSVVGKAPVDGSMDRNMVDADSPVIVNDLLCFVDSYRSTIPHDKLELLISDSFSADAIRSAISILRNSTDSSPLDAPSIPPTGGNHAGVLLSLFHHLAPVPRPRFAATNLTALPLFVKVDLSLQDVLSEIRNLKQHLVTNNSNSCSSASCSPDASVEQLAATAATKVPTIAASSPESPVGKPSLLAQKQTPNTLEDTIEKLRKRTHAAVVSNRGQEVRNRLFADEKRAKVQPPPRAKPTMQAPKQLTKTLPPSSLALPSMPSAPLMAPLLKSPMNTGTLASNLQQLAAMAQVGQRQRFDQSATPAGDQSPMQGAIQAYYTMFQQQQLLSSLMSPVRPQMNGSVEASPMKSPSSSLFPDLSRFQLGPAMNLGGVPLSNPVGQILPAMGAASAKACQMVKKDPNILESPNGTVVSASMLYTPPVSANVPIDGGISLKDELMEEEEEDDDDEEEEDVDVADDDVISGDVTNDTTNALDTAESPPGGKPYVCKHSHCRKRFNNKFLLKKHEFIHTGERPHQCPFCGKRFNRKDNLLRHKKTHIANAYHSSKRRHTLVFGVPTAAAMLGAQNRSNVVKNDSAIA